MDNTASKKYLPIEHVVSEWCRDPVINKKIVAVAERLWTDPPGGTVPYVFGELIGFATPEEKAAYVADIAQQVAGTDANLMLEGESVESVAREALATCPELMQSLLRTHVQRVGNFIQEVLMARLKDFQFRYLNPSLGYGWETALSKARAGDEEALLAILQVFPEAQFNEPCLTEPLQQLWNNSSGFRHRYEEVRTCARRLDPRAKPLQHALFVLCMNPNLVREQTTTTSRNALTATKVFALLEELKVTKDSGVDPQSFAAWCRRRFTDLPKKRP